MRRLIHLMLSPSCRLARLMVAEKRVACDQALAEDARNCLPLFVEMDGTRCEGVWAILDHLEGHYPDRPLAPEDADERRACLRWLDWAMGPLHEHVTQRIVYEKAAPRFTGSPAQADAGHECDPPGTRGTETGAGGNRQGGRDATAIWRRGRLRWAISRWRRICRRWIISAKCRGRHFPPPRNGICG